MEKKLKQRQHDFMETYASIHEDFVRFCQARAHKIMPYQDLVSESVLIGLKHWDQIKKKDSLKYYLFTTARNLVLNTLRKKREDTLDEAISNKQVSYNKAEQNLEIEHLYECLDQLADTKKEALILFEISGFSIKEIAEIQHSTPGAVKAMLSRARTELKLLIEQEAPVSQMR